MRRENVLKVPSDTTIGMTEDLYEYIQENGEIELYGSIRVPGRGLITPEDHD